MGQSPDYDIERIVRAVKCTVLFVKNGEHHQKVLAATDFSDKALPVIEKAVEEYRCRGSALTLLHSLDLTRPHTPDMLTGLICPGGIISPMELKRPHLQADWRPGEAMRQFTNDGKTCVANMPPGVAIVELAKQLDAALVVIGTNGRTGLARLLMGSVAEQAIRMAPCSVLVVRKHPDSSITLPPSQFHAKTKR